jgi:hypothetical protein
MTDTVAQCPCGIARVECDYHRPEEPLRRYPGADPSTARYLIGGVWGKAAGDRITLLIGSESRVGTVVEVRPGAIVVVLDGEVRAVSAKVRFTVTP